MNPDKQTFNQNLKGAIKAVIILGLIYYSFYYFIIKNTPPDNIEIDYLEISGNKVALNDSGKVTKIEYTSLDSVKFYIIDEVVYVVR